MLVPLVRNVLDDYSSQLTFEHQISPGSDDGAQHSLKDTSFELLSKAHLIWAAVVMLFNPP